MNSTAPAGDRSRPQKESRRRTPADAALMPGDAICTPVLPAHIRIPFPAFSFECGGTRYRTRPMELVALPCEAGKGGEAERMGEERAWKMEDEEGKGAAPLSAPERSAPSSSLHPPSSPDTFSLRRGLGAWHLVFEGRPALLRHERGLLYVAWLLHHPPTQPLHALDLVAKIPELYRAQLGLQALTDPATGQVAALASHARLQERSLALDDAQSLRALRRHTQELEAILDDDAASEPVKAEALRELETLMQFQREHGRRSRDTASRAANTVRQAMLRLHANLAAAVDAHGVPHPVLRAFAAHLEQYLLLRSGRGAGHGGCFTYEPPPGVQWHV